MCELQSSAMPRACKRRAAFKHLAEVEHGLINKLTTEGKGPREIADLLKRNVSTIRKHRSLLKKGKAPKASGRPRALTPKQVDRLVSKAEKMTEAADAQYQVTAKMIRDALGFKCSLRVVLDALHERGVYFRPLREKPVRTPEDDRARLTLGGARVSMRTSTTSSSLCA